MIKPSAFLKAPAKKKKKVLILSLEKNIYKLSKTVFLMSGCDKEIEERVRERERKREKTHTSYEADQT